MQYFYEQKETWDISLLTPDQIMIKKYGSYNRTFTCLFCSHMQCWVTSEQQPIMSGFEKAHILPWPKLIMRYLYQVTVPCK